MKVWRSKIYLEMSSKFLGDEMNVYCMHNLQGMIEIEELASIKNNIMSYGKSQTNYGLKDDALVGTYCLGEAECVLTKQMVAQLLSKTDIPLSSIKLENRSYTGTEYISMILPPGLNYQYGKLHIVDGKVINGSFSKKTIGISRECIINHIYNMYGNNMALRFINNLQKSALEYLLYRGFALTLQDIHVDEQTTKKKNEIFDEYEMKAQQMILEEQLSRAKGESKLTPVQFEEKMFNYGTKVDPDCMNISQSYLTKDVRSNNVQLMYASGSKGKPNNLQQMSACVGQVSLFYNNKRMRVYRRCNGRTFPFYTKNNYSLQANGCVRSSFLEGMRFDEVFSHVVGSRIGLIDKGVGTADTGYIQRKLVKSLEGTMLYYDGSVRNANGQIVQFVTGSNNIQPSNIIELPYPILMLSNEQILKDYCFDKSEFYKYNLTQEQNNSLYVDLLRMRDDLRQHSMRYWNNSSKMNNTFEVPFNLQEVIIAFRNHLSPEDKKKSSDLTYPEIIQMIDNLINDPLLRLINYKGDGREIIQNIHYHHQRVVFYFIRTILNPKQVIINNITRDMLSRIIGFIRAKYIETRQSAGEMIGVIAAQSIGEPATQLTLNSFHYAGVSAGNSSNLSIKRVKELLNITESDKLNAPEMRVYFDEQISGNREAIQKIANIIKCIYIYDVLKESRVIFDQIGNIDKETGISPSKPWLFCYDFSEAKLKSLNLEVHHITDAIEQMFAKKNKNITKKITALIEGTPTITNTNKDGVYTVIVRLNVQDTSQSSLIDVITLFEEYVKITGITNIINAYVVETDKIVINETSGEITTKKEFFVYTEGVNIPDILCLDHLDLSRLESNDFYEMNRIFGIESVRKMMFNEYRAIITANDAVNSTHVSLLVDFECHKANMVAITASKNKGVNTLALDPLTRATFEETTKNLVTSAMYNEVDRMRYVSSSIMSGQLGKFGTGMTELSLNTKMIQKYGKLSHVGEVLDTSLLINETSLTNEVEHSNVMFNIPLIL